MTTKHWLAAAALGVASLGMQGALAHGDAKPKHGGVVQVSNDLSFELVGNAAGVVIYVEDHGKPKALNGMSGKITVLNGSEKSEANLVVAGDRFEAKGLKLASGAKVVAALQTAEKKAFTVRFTVK